MTLLDQLKTHYPEAVPPIRLPTQTAFEAYVEGELRRICEEKGLSYALARLPDGRYIAQVEGKQALSFSGWKALAKALLELEED